jgi:serine/threonine protein kinase HipA of HipAB toxin-antitoxin module
VPQTALQGQGHYITEYGGEECYGTRSYRPFNRGTKLRRVVEDPVDVVQAVQAGQELPRPSMWLSHAIDEPYEVSMGVGMSPSLSPSS